MKSGYESKLNARQARFYRHRLRSDRDMQIHGLSVASIRHCFLHHGKDLIWQWIGPAPV